MSTLLQGVLALIFLAGPHGVGACQTVVDCAYAGQCVAGRCECNVAWTGSNCTELRLLPSPSLDAAGLRRESSSSWGGSVIWDAERERWAMFFADVEEHCGLDTWKRNSRICMATNANSSSPTGPFTFDDSKSSGAAGAVVMPSWSHNPIAYGPIATPPGDEGESSPVYLIYHIGFGHVGTHGWPRKDCTNGTTPKARRHPRTAKDPLRTPPSVLPKVMMPNILVSTSLSGPWTPHKWDKVGWTCNNPAAEFLKNGTVILVCKVMVNMGPDNRLWRQMAIYVAPNWKGPYVFRRLTPIYGEDAYIWHDPDADSGTGAFHILYHAMHPFGKTPSTAWSKDGLEWIPNGYARPPNPRPRASFGFTIPLAGGGAVQLQRRERHQPIFKDGKLVGLCNGVTTSRENDYSFNACVPVATEPPDADAIVI